MFFLLEMHSPYLWEKHRDIITLKCLNKSNKWNILLVFTVLTSNPKQRHLVIFLGERIAILHDIHGWIYHVHGLLPSAVEAVVPSYSLKESKLFTCRLLLRILWKWVLLTLSWCNFTVTFFNLNMSLTALGFVGMTFWNNRAQSTNNTWWKTGGGRSGRKALLIN